MIDPAFYALGFAMCGLVGWFTVTLVLIEPFLMRPVARALSGARFERSFFRAGAEVTWVIQNRAEVGSPNLIEAAYWLSFWTIAIVLPLAVGFLAMYVDWQLGR